jgi:hypothetical protein
MLITPPRNKTWARARETQGLEGDGDGENGRDGDGQCERNDDCESEKDGDGEIEKDGDGERDGDGDGESEKDGDDERGGDGDGERNGDGDDERDGDGDDERDGDGDDERDSDGDDERDGDGDGGTRESDSVEKGQAVKAVSEVRRSTRWFTWRRTSPQFCGVIAGTTRLFSSPLAPHSALVSVPQPPGKSPSWPAPVY